jgi:hypothetical protein
MLFLVDLILYRVVFDQHGFIVDTRIEMGSIFLSIQKRVVQVG